VAIITHLQAGQAPMAYCSNVIWCDSSNLYCGFKEKVTTKYLSVSKSTIKKTKMKTTQAITNATRNIDSAHSEIGFKARRMKSIMKKLIVLIIATAFAITMKLNLTPVIGAD